MAKNSFVAEVTFNLIGKVLLHQFVLFLSQLMLNFMILHFFGKTYFLKFSLYIMIRDCCRRSVVLRFLY